MPASRARFMIRPESARSSLPHGPNIIAPRHSGLTRTPVRPRVRCSMIKFPSSGRSAEAVAAEPRGHSGIAVVEEQAGAGVELADADHLVGSEVEVEDLEVLG